MTESIIQQSNPAILSRHNIAEAEALAKADGACHAIVLMTADGDGKLKALLYPIGLLPCRGKNHRTHKNPAEL